jgi:signal transduction histidine kinase
MANGLLHILVIDDDSGDRTFCQRTLKSAWGDNLHFLEADSGESGLEAIEKQAPDCVLLDHSLPGINGIEVLRRIRLKHPYLPVVMIDGKGNDVVAVQSMKDGAQDYIAKNTITPPILQRVVQMAIEHAILQKNTHEQRTSLEIFTRALAHDLKEPLRTICSFLDLIPDWRTLSEDSQTSFQYVRNAANRMNALVDTVYLYTRLDAVEQMEKTTCDISDILKAVQENLAQLITERGATITCGELPLVHANRTQMVQLFQNLVANAIQHCETPVTIHVSATPNDDQWQIEVRDNGPGVDVEYLEKIFDPFKRLSLDTDNHSGSGLGLAISRKIVDSHGGKIWCQSEPGLGSSFLFTLPQAAEAKTTTAALPKTVGTTTTLARILLVDDNPGDIELNRIMLVKYGKLRCEVLTARGGKEALASLRLTAQENNPIDLVLLDINMPGMSGFDLLVEMEKAQMLAHTQVIMCTTSAYDKDEQTAKLLGAAGYLTKPPQFDQFKDIIARCQNLNLSQESEGFALRRTA